MDCYLALSTTLKNQKSFRVFVIKIDLKNLVLAIIFKLSDIWWAVQDLNLRPLPCKGNALPAELTARNKIRNTTLVRYQIYRNDVNFYRISQDERIKKFLRRLILELKQIS